VNLNGGKISGFGTPVPIKAREEQNRKVDNTVTTYRLTPEQMEKELERLKIKPKPVAMFAEVHENKQIKEMNDVGKLAGEEGIKRDNTPVPMPEKEEYLALRASGMTREACKNHYNVGYGTFYKWLDTWKIKSRHSEELAIYGYRMKHGLISDESTGVSAVQKEQDDKCIDEPLKNDTANSQTVTEGVYSDAYEPECGIQVEKKEETTSVKFITIRIPVYNTNTPPVQQLKKVLAEMEELSDELEMTAGNRERILHELFDVFEAVTHWLAIDISQLFVGDTDKFDLLQQLIHYHNKKHIDKLANYALERGWGIY
jgi:hypothetical protein